MKSGVDRILRVGYTWNGFRGGGGMAEIEKNEME